MDQGGLGIGFFLLFFLLFVLFLFLQEGRRPQSGFLLFLLTWRGHFGICRFTGVAFSFGKCAISVGFFPIKCVITCCKVERKY